MHPPESSSQYIVTKAITEFSCRAPGQLANYLAEVLRWNSTLGLVSRRDPLAASERLLLESLELSHALGPIRGHVADIGSGAGFPGLVWAIESPHVDVTLIERSEKRSAFLERTSHLLKVDNAAVICADARDVARRSDFESRFDIAVTMAVGDPAKMAPAVELLLGPGGRFVSTISSTRTPADAIGTHLVLTEHFEGKFGRYAFYRRGV